MLLRYCSYVMWTFLASPGAGWEKRACKTDGFPALRGYTEKPKQTLQNNYICFFDDRKTLGVLTGGL